MRYLLLIFALCFASLQATVTVITDEASYQTALNAPVVVIDFYANWCGPCKQMDPILKSLSQKFPHIQFIKVNIDTFRSIASNWNIRSLPTLIILKNGGQVFRRSGVMSKSDLAGILRQY